MGFKDNIVYDKSYKFAIRVVNLYKFLQSEHKEFVLSRQLLRSGTSIGALIREAQYAQSKADFINKLSIALNPDYAVEITYLLQIICPWVFTKKHRLTSGLNSIFLQTPKNKAFAKYKAILLHNPG